MERITDKSIDKAEENHPFVSYIREEFTVNGTQLVLEDRINTLHPWLSERVLCIVGTGACYSSAPVCPASHRLLCFNYCANALKMMQPDPFRYALVLGCGGGAVPRWLLEEYPTVNVDVVDCSPEIISVCKKYFLQRWESSDRLKYYCADAKDYRQEYQYQFVFCDLFDGENLAPVVSCQTFAEKLRSMLSEDGFLIVNCGWNNSGEVVKVYQNVFNNVNVLDKEAWKTQVIIGWL